MLLKHESGLTFQVTVSYPNNRPQFRISERTTYVCTHYSRKAMIEAMRRIKPEGWKLCTK